MMTTLRQALSAAQLRTATAVFTVLMGVAMISVTGHVQASALHDAAHDVRHATGFPCH